jgi:hypothetical protein
MHGFFNAYREGQRVTRNLLRDIAQKQGVMTLLISTLSTPRKIKYW